MIEFIFEQDGPPSNYSRNVRDDSNERFRGLWIGRIPAIEEPSRSPDLKPLEFYLCGHIYMKVALLPMHWKT